MEEKKTFQVCVKTRPIIYFQWGRNEFYLGEDRKNFLYLEEDQKQFFPNIIIVFYKNPKI